MGNRLNRIFMERVLGIHHQREMPSAEKPFRLKRKAGQTCKRKAAYFAGCFARFNDVNGEAQATLKVLGKNGVEVLVPEQKCCGIAMITVGSEADAKKNARYNVEVLAPLVKQGYEVVASAPSCALAIYEDYPRLLDTENAHLVSQATREIHQYLWDLHQRGELNRDFKPVDLRLVWHNPCHSKALGVEREPIEILRLIPGITVEEIADSCCGMAGTFGFKTENFDLSMKIGNKLFDEIKRTKVATVATSCGTCNIQIAQGTRLKVRHTLSILAEAYGV
jgi:Fe-S oxidoreductase